MFFFEVGDPVQMARLISTDIEVLLSAMRCEVLVIEEMMGGQFIKRALASGRPSVVVDGFVVMEDVKILDAEALKDLGVESIPDWILA